MHICKLFPLLILFIIGSLSAYNQIVIKLVKAYPARKYIELNYYKAEVHSLQRVQWTIIDPNIESFKILRKDRKTKNIFFEDPERDFDTELKVRTALPSERDWEYKIIWKQKGDTKEYTYDPIIAVKPGLGFAFTMLSVIILGLLGFVGYKLLKK